MSYKKTLSEFIIEDESDAPEDTENPPTEDENTPDEEQPQESGLKLF